MVDSIRRLLERSGLEVIKMVEIRPYDLRFEHTRARCRGRCRVRVTAPHFQAACVDAGKRIGLRRYTACTAAIRRWGPKGGFVIAVPSSTQQSASRIFLLHLGGGVRPPTPQTRTGDRGGPG